jgi:hypothetical protein
MEDFYFYTLVVAVVLLIIMLTMIGITMSYKNSLQSFPPTDNKCPDYWEIAPDGYCQYPGSGTATKAINYGNDEFIDSNAKKLLHDTVTLNYKDTTGGNLLAKVSNNSTYTSAINVADKTAAKTTIGDTGSGDGFLYLKLNNDDDRWQKIETNAYAGLSTRCAKKKWAQKYGLHWDGITNYNGCK